MKINFFVPFGKKKWTQPQHIEEDQKSVDGTFVW